MQKVACECTPCEKTTKAHIYLTQFYITNESHEIDYGSNYRADVADYNQEGVFIVEFSLVPETHMFPSEFPVFSHVYP